MDALVQPGKLKSPVSAIDGFSTTSGPLEYPFDRQQLLHSCLLEIQECHASKQLCRRIFF